MIVVSSRSSVSRSRSLVTLPAENTGPDEHVEQHHVADVPRGQFRLPVQAHRHERNRQEHAHLNHQPQHQRALAENLAPHFLVVDRIRAVGQQVGRAWPGRTADRETDRAESPAPRPAALPASISTTSFPSLPTSGGCSSRRRRRGNSAMQIAAQTAGSTVTVRNSRNSPAPPRSCSKSSTPTSASGRISRYETTSDAAVRWK